MMYLLAIVLPPLALLFQGRVFQALLNLVLFAFSLVFALLSFGTLWMICVAWAVVVVYRDRDEARTRRIVADTLRGQP